MIDEGRAVEEKLNQLNHNALHDLILTMNLWRDSMYPSLIFPQVLLSQTVDKSNRTVQGLQPWRKSGILKEKNEACRLESMAKSFG